MALVRQFILSITACAVICSIVKAFIPKSSAYHGVVSIVAGLILLLSAIKPILHVESLDLSAYSDGWEAESNLYTQSGQASASEAMISIIKQQTESYILDKAADLEANITASVTLDPDNMIPAAVTILGDVSPYAREALCIYMEDSLGIPRENQIWN